MYSARPGLLIGFHGCETELRNDVIAGNRALNASKNMHDWLGNGIYFWENNYERALDFAMNPPGKRQFDVPSVLGAVIENLHPERDERGQKPFDSVRGVFVEGNELYPGAGFNDKNHIQICIRNPNCIKGYFLPRSEIRWPAA
jgi:hypothetical protein